MNIHPCARPAMASLLVIAVAALGFTGCVTPPRIDTEASPTADFTERRTFAWQESRASYDPAPASTDVVELKQAIHDAVVEQLAQKGYSEAGSGNPDFLVSFHLVVSVTRAPELCLRRHLIFEWPRSPAPLDMYEICQRDPLMMSGRTVRQGTLVVFVVDAATRNLLWQGVADRAAVSRRNQIERLRSAVQEMFAAFPGGRA